MESPIDAAQWIGACPEYRHKQPAAATYFRKSFQLKEAPESAQLFITALGLYEAEVNGHAVGDKVFAPGWTCYEKRVPFQVYNIKSALTAGENVLGAILGNGWYSGHLAWVGRQLYGKHSHLRAAVLIRYRDGRQETICSDSSWKHRTGPILENDLLMGETYDARLELTGWSGPEFDDSQWPYAESTKPDPEPQLCEPMGPPVRRIQTLPVVKYWDIAKEDCRLRIYDFGQNFSGRIKMAVRAQRGTQLRFRFGEMVSADETLYTANLRGAKCTDTYICKGGDLETWEPRFTFHGFRYVEADITPLDEPDDLEIVGVVLHNDMAVTGHFECSNPLLNQLQHNILWGQKSNFLEVPMDCPQRDERLGWTGDAQVFVRTACFNMDVQSFFHKWMRDHRDSQSRRGAIPSVVPDRNLLEGREDGGPAWSDATIICPWTIYLCYGDEQILKDHYACMCRYIEYLNEHASQNYIRSHPDLDVWHGYGDWLALDGGASLEGQTALDLIGTAFFAYVVELMSQVAALLGHTEDVKKFHTLHARIVDAFQRRFVTPEGLLASATQTAYVLALHFNLMPGKLRSLAAKELVRDIQKKDYHIGTGFVGTPYILEVLEKTGYLDIAYRLLEQKTYPSWLFPVLNKATTIWERWDGWTPDKGFQHVSMNSFNHYAYGAVGAWMYNTVAGIELDPEKPGYRHIIFRPTPGGTITWAKASLVTPQGITAIHWRLSELGLQIDVIVPEGAYATVNAPHGYGEANGIYTAGSHTIILKSSKATQEAAAIAYESAQEP